MKPYVMYGKPVAAKDAAKMVHYGWRKPLSEMSESELCYMLRRGLGHSEYIEVSGELARRRNAAN